MSASFNYKHLYYFWVVAKEGGISRAADKLDMAVQTVSAQVRELERSLGCELLKPAGRGLALTDAGVAAMASFCLDGRHTKNRHIYLSIRPWPLLR